MPVLTKERSKERTSSHDLVIKSPHFSRPTLWLTPPVGDRQGPRVHDTKILFLGRSISYTPGQPQPTQAISLGLPPCLDIEAAIWTCRGNTLSVSVTQFHTHLDAPISLLKCAQGRGNDLAVHFSVTGHFENALRCASCDP